MSSTKYVIRPINKTKADWNSPLTKSCYDTIQPHRPIKCVLEVPDLYEKIARIIRSDKFVVVDVLAIAEEDGDPIFYALLSSLDKRPELRFKGMIVDVSSQRIVYEESAIYEETCSSLIFPRESDPKIVDVGRNLLYKITENGSWGDFGKTPALFRPAMDGVRVRVFLERGIVFVCTRKKLYLRNSAWVGKTSFHARWEQCIGNSPEFEPSFMFGGVENGCEVYCFTIVSNELMVASKCDLPDSDPFMIYQRMDKVTKPLPGATSGTNVFKTTPVWNVWCKRPDFVDNLKVLRMGIFERGTKDQFEFLDLWLKNGWWKDNNPAKTGDGNNTTIYPTSRSYTGEAILCSYKSASGINRIIKVKPPPYTFMNVLRGSDKNLTTRCLAIVEEIINLAPKDLPFPPISARFMESEFLKSHLKNIQNNVFADFFEKQFLVFGNAIFLGRDSDFRNNVEELIIKMNIERGRDVDDVWAKEYVYNSLAHLYMIILGSPYHTPILVESWFISSDQTLFVAELFILSPLINFWCFEHWFINHNSKHSVEYAEIYNNVLFGLGDLSPIFMAQPGQSKYSELFDQEYLDGLSERSPLLKLCPGKWTDLHPNVGVTREVITRVSHAFSERSLRERVIFTSKFRKYVMMIFNGNLAPPKAKSVHVKKPFAEFVVPETPDDEWKKYNEHQYSYAAWLKNEIEK